MVVHQNITNLAGYFHFLNVRKIPYVIVCIAHTPLNLWLDGEAKVLYHLAFSFNLEGVALAS